MPCSNHPDNDSYYYDYTRDKHLCTDCVVGWFDNRRGDHHAVDKNLEARKTAEVPEFQITVSNVEYARANKSSFDLVLGVSDTYEECDTHWFPINEVAPWSYAPFFWFKRIMDKAVQEKKKVLIHCHAGAHRSKMMVFVWLIYQVGWTVEMAQERLHMVRQFDFDVAKGYIPPHIFFFQEIMDQHPTWSLAGCLREIGREQLLTNGCVR